MESFFIGVFGLVGQFHGRAIGSIGRQFRKAITPKACQLSDRLSR
jgi:hypothetical protein